MTKLNTINSLAYDISCLLSEQTSEQINYLVTECNVKSDNDFKNMLTEYQPIEYKLCQIMALSKNVPIDNYIQEMIDNYCYMWESDD